MAEHPTGVARVIARRAMEHGLRVAVAESLTGGELSVKLACAPDAGTWFVGGLIAYGSDVKRSLLGVPDGTVVSKAAVEAMADGIVRLVGADVAVAVTGVAGPDPQDGQPPGTVWFATHRQGATRSELVHLRGDPDAIVTTTVTCALEFLRDVLL